MRIVQGYNIVRNKNAAKGLIFKVTLIGKTAVLHIAGIKARWDSSTSGVKFCNSSVNDNITFQTGSAEDFSIGGMDNFSVGVPTGSLAVVLIPYKKFLKKLIISYLIF